MSADASAPGGSVVLCPGQGAQYVGQGKAWRDASDAARAVFERADKYLGKSRLPGNRTVSDMCFNGPKDVLDRTDAAQPAIFVTSMACWAALKQFGHVSESDVTAAAGLSLGEYTALVLAGGIEFEAALELVTLRGRAMQLAAENSDGGMVALLGASEEQAAQVCAAAGTPREVLVAANFNAPGQVVVSGAKPACDRAVRYAAKELGLKASALAVAGAFHSPLMQPAADRLGEALADTHIAVPLARTVMSNVTAEPHESDADAVRARLVQQLTSPVRWAACVQYLLAGACGGAKGSARFIELAPGRTLAGIMKRIERRRAVIGYDEPPAAAS